jgi:hypothetical protein
MLEATIVDLVFTISLKRSTLNCQLSTSCQADYPIYWLRVQQAGARPWLLVRKIAAANVCFCQNAQLV